MSGAQDASPTASGVSGVARSRAGAPQLPLEALGDDAGANGGAPGTGLAANPLLPKILFPEQKQPPQCPLKDIQFVQLQKFKRFKDQMMMCKMGDGFDQVGKKNMMRENREKRKAYDSKRGEEETEARMDEFTHIIQNVVYARDPKIFDTKNGYVNQRNAF